MNRRLILLFALFVSLPAPALEIHGQADVFSGHGVALAWAVARGADEERTFVVVRLVTAPAIRAISVKGQDPFTKADRNLVDRRPTTGCLDIRIPRSSFAEFPRTEWTFHGSGNDTPLVVFYLGVPDTTPEFADQSRLGAYLRERVAYPSICVSPHTESAWPEIVLPRGLATKVTRSASCSGVTYSLIEVYEKTSFSISSNEIPRAFAFAVSTFSCRAPATTPGSSAFTRMPASPSSIASDFVSPITPHFAAA